MYAQFREDYTLESFVVVYSFESSEKQKFEIETFTMMVPENEELHFDVEKLRNGVGILNLNVQCSNALYSWKYTHDVREQEQRGSFAQCCIICIETKFQTAI